MTLLAAYNFDNASEGATVYDETGNHNGSVVGTVPLSNGPISSKKRVYSGTDGNYIAVPDHVDFSMVVDKTFEIWVSFGSVSDPNHRYFLTKHKDTVNWQFFFALNGSSYKPQFYVEDSNSQSLSIIADTVPTIDVPHYIVVTWDSVAKAAQMFYDGAAIVSGSNGSITPSLLDNDSPTAIGGFFAGGGGDWIMIGDIHAVRFSDTIKTPEEIHATYTGGRPKENNLWP